MDEELDVYQLKSDDGVELELDTGVVMRAIDTLLFLAPKEFRSPQEWMLRLYKARVNINKFIESEREFIVERAINGEGIDTSESFDEFDLDPFEEIEIRGIDTEGADE
jgi:hypothetical protein